MPRYTAYAYDLVTNRPLAELPLNGLRFSSLLSGAGDFSASMTLPPIGDTSRDGAELLKASQPARTALYIDRGGRLVWGGIIWNRRWNDGRLDLNGAEFFSYADHRIIPTTITYTQIDQTAIASDLINRMQSGYGASIGIVLDTPASGILRDRTYTDTNRKPYGEAISDLAKVIQGFEFAIDVAWTADGVPTKTFRTGYPTRGRSAAVSGLVWELPGNVESYGWPEDGERMANHLHVVGEGTIRVTYTLNFSMDEGYPLLEDHLSLTDVSQPVTLDAHAERELNQRYKPLTVLDLTVRADAFPEFGTYSLGDEFTLIVKDERFPQGMTKAFRIVGYSVETEPQETVKLHCSDVGPLNTWWRLKALMKDQEARLRRMETAV